MKKLLALALFSLCGLSPFVHADEKSPYQYRWLYAQVNLLTEAEADRLIQLIARAQRSGYNGVVLSDTKFGFLNQMPESYFANAARVKRAARDSQIEIIPLIFSFGYSSSLLANDPNLAEGIPVVGAPFQITGNQAVLVPDPAVRIINGDFEVAKEHRFPGFLLQDDPGKTTFADHQVVHSGKSSFRIEDNGEKKPYRNYRLAQRVRVRPHAGYRFSAWVKTRELNPTGGFQLMVRGTGWKPKQLSFYQPQLKSTQDWSQLEVVFNTLDESEVDLYIGQWGSLNGTIWLDDLALNELALVNVLRREGCPLTVTSEDGKIVYQEGSDFEPVRDVQLGQVPWAGEYSFAHPGAPLKLTTTSQIKNGQRIRVSWYHPIVINGFQVTACLTEKKIFELLQDQAKAIQELFQPETFFMAHDEIRVANWCQTCQAKKQNAGELLATNIARCVKIIRDLNPTARLVVWSDMFDPNHNAVDDYYLVRGSLKNSWRGLPSDVIIANWNLDHATESLKWFAARGHRQIIAGYYDTDLGNLQKWEAAARQVLRVEGFMYTTWENKYEMLEAYGKALRRK
jgi:hypothetical protein